eukprot:COSAG02_NODE_3314_length_6953_cov_4.605924_5_plen_87_part_00
MEMMTVERQVVNPFFTGGEVISVSYPSERMSHADKISSMSSNATHLSHATVQVWYLLPPTAPLLKQGLNVVPDVRHSPNCWCKSLL